MSKVLDEIIASAKRQHRSIDEHNPFTEDALALRFSERHAHDLRYIAIRAQWLKWDGARWYIETTLLAFDLARRSCRKDAQHTTTESHDQVYSAPRPSPRSSASPKPIAAKRPRSSNGTPTIICGQPQRNLRSANRRKASPTRTTTLPRPRPASQHVPARRTRMWTPFLERVAPDPELRAFLSASAAIASPGHLRAHVRLLLRHRRQRQGHLHQHLAAILGDYATIADVGTFIASHNDRHPTDVAKLHGVPPRRRAGNREGPPLGREPRSRP